MPYSITWSHEGTEIIYEGKVSYAEIRAADDAHYGDERFQDIRYQLCDFTKADTSEITLSDAEEYAVFDVVSIPYKPHLKVAMVSYNLGTKYLLEEYIKISKEEGSSWKFKIFDNYLEAKKWCSG